MWVSMVEIKWQGASRIQDAPHPSRLRQTVGLPTSSTVGMSLLEGQQVWLSKQADSNPFLQTSQDTSWVVAPLPMETPT